LSAGLGRYRDRCPPRAGQTGQHQAHREKLSGERIHHQPQSLESHGAEQRCVARPAEHNRRGSASSFDLNTTLRHVALDRRAIRERELYDPIAPEPEATPNILREHRVDSTRVDEETHRYGTPASS